MNCDRCGGHEWERVADLGGGVLARCTACEHNQILRAQAPRGLRSRYGLLERGLTFSGVINV